MSHIHIGHQVDDVSAGHAWRDNSGLPHATVNFGGSWVEFSDADLAEKAAAACQAAADAIRGLPPAPDGSQS